MNGAESGPGQDGALATRKPSLAHLRTRARRALGIRDALSAAAVVVGRLLLRRGPSPGRGVESDESPVIIAGMHRSGTSLVSRLLERGGMYVGGSWVDEHHESIHFTRANRAMNGEGLYMLHDYGWTAPKTDGFIQARRGYAERAAATASIFFAERRDEIAWGWKDPRNCLTLPVWLSIYPGARVLHVVRDGRAVALSLADRDELDPAFGLDLWAHHVTRTEGALEGVLESQKLTVRYEDLMETPVETLRGLFEFAHLPPPDSLDGLAVDIDPSRVAARLADPRLGTLSHHPLLDRYGYG